MLLIASNGEVRIGQPTLEGARVIAEVIEHGRDAKIIVFKYKAKTRYRRRKGHRQGYTRLAVRQILTAEGPIEAEEKPKAEAKPARRARRPKPEPEAEATVAEAASVEAPEGEAKPARRTRARKPEAEAPSAEAPPDKTPEAEAKPARRARARKRAPGGEAESPQKGRRPSRRKTKAESD